jgi:FkbH-like protein
MNTDDQTKEAIKAANCFEEVIKVCRNVDISSLSNSTARKILRSLSKHKPTADDIATVSRVKIAYLGNITFEPLPEYVEVIAACRGIITDTYVGGYDQYIQELIDEHSGLSKSGVDIIFICLTLRELSPVIISGFSSLSTDQVETTRKTILDNTIQTVDLALDRQDAVVIISNFSSPSDYQFGIAEQKQTYGECEFYAELNLGLKNHFIDEPRVHVLDMDRLTSVYGKKNAFNDKMYYMAKSPWHEGFYPCIADQLVRYIEIIKGLTKKCLVLDLDNTLWGGVLGESGPHGVKIGHGDGVSEAFYDFQHNILSLKNRGILLAVCSKNNPEDVEEIFHQRTDMPLKLEDFSALEVGWDMKHDGLVRISENLNIGLDSLIFLDDSPAECELIRQLLPQIETIQLPPDPSMYSKLLASLHGLDKTMITSEDQMKTRQYADNASRTQHQERFDDIELYLESLQTEISIGVAGEDEKMRIHQLFSKTNQFNVTTKRYSMADVENMIEMPGLDLYTVQARDRFGDLGMIGLCVIECEATSEAVIDSFILSCRAMGRGIETAMLNYIKEEYFGRRGLACLRALFSPTKKNKPALDFYTDQGFVIEEGDLDTGLRYTQLVGSSTLKNCHWIIVNERKIL